MAEQVKTGIIVTLEDRASKALGALGKAAKTTAGSFGVLGSAGRAVGAGIVVFNQALELGKKALETFRLGFELTIQKALEFRRANDRAVKDFEKMRKEINLLQARIGDALLPVLNGIGKAMAPVLRSWRAWITENRKLIGLKIVAFLERTARFLTDVVSFAALTAAKSWGLFREAVVFANGIMAEFMASTSSGIASMLNGFANLASALGRDELAGDLAAAADGAKAFSDAATEGAKEYGDELKTLQDEIKATEERILNMNRKVHSAISQVADTTRKQIEESTVGTNTSLEESKANADAIRKSALAELEADALRMKAAAEKRAQIKQERIADMNQLLSTSLQVGAGIGNAMGEAFARGENAAKAFAKSALLSIIDLVVASINAYAAQAAAAFVASSAAGGPVGLAIGFAGAGAVMGGVRGFIAQAFADGGIVQGGTPGKDSVPILAQQGEAVLDVQTTQRLINILQGAGSQNKMSFADGGVVSGGGGGGGGNLTLQTIFPPTDRGALRRMLRDVVKPELDALNRGGF